MKMKKMEEMSDVFHYFRTTCVLWTKYERTTLEEAQRIIDKRISEFTGKKKEKGGNINEMV